MVDGVVKRIGVTRIHIEEDAGKLLHDEAFAGSLVDLNRCGVPLIEIVSEPDIRSSAEAKAYLETIKSILQYINISDCKMQEGSIRCDVNVSVREKGATEFGTRCEMKNVNSFSAAVRGIEYEAKRQIEILEAGGTIVQETRRWDDAKGMSFTMRSKEDAQDYRYFPEPDLLTIVVDEGKVQALKESIPELPNAKIRRYVEDFGLSQIDATLIAEDLERSALFDACVDTGTCKPKSVCNWILSDIAKFTNDTGKKISETPLTAERLVVLIAQVEKGVISNSSAKTVLKLVLEKDADPLAIIEEQGMAQNSDQDFLENLAKEVLADNEKSVSDYKNGKTNALGYLVGQCMKRSKGKANPGIVKEIVTRMLSE
jgi:aspartyl-tRNA(Asn)/glutamyl-tRNA(Gln) amidotransferase subunit B